MIRAADCAGFAVAISWKMRLAWMDVPRYAVAGLGLFSHICLGFVTKGKP